MDEEEDKMKRGMTAPVEGPGSAGHWATVENEKRQKMAQQTAGVSPMAKQAQENFNNAQPVANYDDLYSRLRGSNPYRMLSQDEVARIRRRQRTEGIVNSAADAARAISNLFATTQYAPNMYDHTKDSMGERTRQRYEKMIADRQAEHEAHVNYALKMKGVKDADDERRYKRGRDKVQDARQAVLDGYAANDEARKAAAAKRAEDLLPYQLAKAEQDAETAKNRAAITKAQADYAAAVQQSLVNKNNRTGTGRGGQKVVGSLFGPDGKKHSFTTNKDYDAAVAEWSDHETWDLDGAKGSREAVIPTYIRAGEINKKNRGKGGNKNTNKYDKTSKINWN